MRDSWVRQLIDVCLSENQRPYFCFLHVRQKIDTIRHDTPQRAHTSNTINDNCINLIRDNWSRVYSLGSFFYYHCFVFYLLLVWKSIYFSAIISLFFDMLCSLIRSFISIVIIFDIVDCLSQAEVVSGLIMPLTYPWQEDPFGWTGQAISIGNYVQLQA